MPFSSIDVHLAAFVVAIIVLVALSNPGSGIGKLSGPLSDQHPGVERGAQRIGAVGGRRGAGRGLADRGPFGL